MSVKIDLLYHLNTHTYYLHTVVVVFVISVVLLVAFVAFVNLVVVFVVVVEFLTDGAGVIIVGGKFWKTLTSALLLLWLSDFSPIILLCTFCIITSVHLKNIFSSFWSSPPIEWCHDSSMSRYGQFPWSKLTIPTREPPKLAPMTHASPSRSINNPGRIRADRRVCRCSCRGGNIYPFCRIGLKPRCRCCPSGGFYRDILEGYRLL